MNRGVFQGSLMQQMMGGSPSWWNMENLRLPTEKTSPLLPTSSPSSSSSSSVMFPQYLQPSHLLLPTPPWHDNQELPETWSQMLLGGYVGEEDKSSFVPFQSKKWENWEDQFVYPSSNALKQESSEVGYVHCNHGSEDMQVSRPSWSQVLPASSPRSCLTNFSSSMLDFSNRKAERMNHQPDHSSECNSTATGAPFKKARVQTSTQSTTFKVRKEKLGDRITALHQLVSPFGKTDTASVLLEAIGYIRFLQGQIEALSSPYIGGSGSGSMRQTVQGERISIFPEDPGQLLNDNSMNKRAASDQDANNEPKMDLRSRGLCLVPVACTMHVGSDNGADYWAPAFGGGF